MPTLALPFPSLQAATMPTELPLGQRFARGRDGDERHYADALRQCAVILRRVVAGKLHRMAPSLLGDSEDLVQECLLALHLKAHTYDATQAFEPWLYAIARYKLIDLLRRRQPGRDVSLDLLLETEDVADPAASTEPQAGADLAVLLAQLPEKQRRPIELVKLEGRSVAEAAASTGLSISAVKVGIHRGLKALAKRLAAEGDLP